MWSEESGLITAGSLMVGTPINLLIDIVNFKPTGVASLIFHICGSDCKLKCVHNIGMVEKDHT